MSAAMLLILVAGLALIGWIVARVRAAGFREQGGRAAALPGHHGWYVALWTLVPPLLFLAMTVSVTRA
ncbi:MAG: phosphate ABC transporter permease subunit PstC, partial [Sphingomonas sp.]